MPRLDYIATLQDSVSPGLRELSRTANNLTDILGGVTLSGTGLTQALSSGLEKVSEGFDDLIRLIARLAIVQGIVTGISGAFRGLFAAISLSLNLLTTLGTVIPIIIKLARGLASVVGVIASGLQTLVRGVTSLLSAVSGAVPIIGTIAKVVGGLALGFDLLFNSARATGSVLGAVAKQLGNISGNLLTQVIPNYLEGLAGPALDQLNKGITALGEVLGLGAGQLKQVVVETYNDLVESVVGAIDQTRLQAIKGYIAELNNVRNFAPEGSREVSQILSDITVNMAGLAADGLVPVILRAKELAEPFSRMLKLIGEFSRLSFNSIAGQLEVLPATLQNLLRATGQVVTDSLKIDDATVIANLSHIQGVISGTLGNLANKIEGPGREIVARLANTLGDRSAQARLSEGLNELLSVLQDPRNQIVLAAGLSTPEIDAAVDTWKALSDRIVAEREALQKRVGDIDETAAERRQRIMVQTTARQVQALLQAGGQLVRDRQNVAIALATLDSGIAIAGAFAYGAKLGPAYLAAYVATVAANLANTINSIRSLSVPAGVVTAAPAAAAEGQFGGGRNQPTEVNITVIGDRFTAEQLRQTAEDITGALSTQLSP